MSFTRKFRKIERRLGKINATSLVALGAVKLREIEQRPAHDYRGWLPWNLLLLMRWAIELGSHVGGAQADEQLLASLMNDAHDLLAVDPYLEDKADGGIEKFFRRMAYQQFWVQRPIVKADLGRLWLLHRDVRQDGELAQAIMEASGLTVRDFVAMCAIVWSIEASRPGVPMTLDQLDRAIGFDRRTIEKFMKCLSTTIGEFARVIKNKKGAVHSRLLQVHERTPFLRYPLVREGESYIVVSKRVLDRAILELPWRVARERRGNDAAMEYGYNLEQYIRRALADSGLEYKDEHELQAISPGSKVSDYCLFGEREAVIIEAKAVEIRPLAALHPVNPVLEKELKDNVQKGIVQGFATASAVHQDDAEKTDPNGWSYSLWIVTPTRLFLGPGISAWDEVLGAPVKENLASSGIAEEHIQPGRIHFLSLEEFDHAMAFVAGRPNEFDRLSSAADQSGSLPGHRKYQFEMCLADIGAVAAPTYVLQACDDLWDYARGLFQEDGKSVAPSSPPGA